MRVKACNHTFLLKPHSANAKPAQMELQKRMSDMRIYPCFSLKLVGFE